MIHVGDITKLNGAELPVVDVITGGSPCQDLSVAGKRAGLAGERSGLFMEQVRIVKEMREHDRSTGRTGYLTRPRYMLWENVPGAFSSNKGEDFRAVLEEIAKVEQEDAHIPRPEGSWPYAGCVMGDGWSIAWRLHDAQFWGVPQRRKRIALVADFGGQSAPEILFERKGMRRDPEESGEEREGTSSDVKGSVAATISCLNDQGGSQMGVTEDVTGTLRAEEHGHQPAIAFTTEITPKIDENGTAFSLRSRDYKDPQSVVYGISAYDSNAMKSSNPHSGVYEAETARTLDNNGGSPACNQGGMAVVCRVKISEDGVVQTLSGRMGTGGGNVPMVMEPVCVGNGQLAQARLSSTVGTLNCMHDQQAPLISTKGNDNAGTQSQILRLLQETYGEETILKWGVAVLDTLQQAEILRQGVHEGGIQSKTQNRQRLDDGSLPCSEFVANWLLRDMRKREKCGCTPQGQKSAEQRFEQFDESMPELSQQNPQTCKDLFNMWEKGERLGLLRQALSEIQEVWQSFDGKGQSVHGCSIVRRLTPLEAERLQGFPDGWTDIGEWTDSKGKMRKCSDSARYKALGNSIAIPFWFYILRRMAAQYERPATLGSLFDGIGGFPLCWERCNGKGTAIWASEVEEFAIAVTKKRFGDR